MKPSDFGHLPYCDGLDHALLTMKDCLLSLAKPSFGFDKNNNPAVKMYTELTGKMCLYPGVETDFPGQESKLDAWEDKARAAVVLIEYCVENFNSLSTGKILDAVTIVEELFVETRAMNAYCSPDKFSYSYSRAVPIEPYLSSQGIIDDFPSLKALAESIVLLTRMPRATEVIGELPEFPKIKEVVQMPSGRREDNLKAVLKALKNASTQISKLKAVDLRALEKEVEALTWHHSVERETRPKTIYKYEPPAIEAPVKQTKSLVEDVLALDKNQIDAFYGDNKDRMSIEKFYGKLLNQVFGLKQKDRIVEGLELLVVHNVITREEKDACLAMEGSPRSMKFREDYLFELIKLAVETHQTRCQIASVIGGPASLLSAEIKCSI